MTDFVVFNSKTTGSVHTEEIAGREHLVTNMVSLVGDTVMNGIMYPNEEVQATKSQLDMLPAPAGHPIINGIPVKAAHPVAINVHNIGAFIRNPRTEGKAIINQLCVDTTVANSTDDGKELIRRMNAKEKVGVSTGLNLQVENVSGVGDDGVTFDRIGRNFQFDHVAILLNQKPAGDHVGTGLKYNGADLIINELSADSLTSQLDNLIDKEATEAFDTWVLDVFPDSKKFVYRLRPNDNSETKLIERGYSVGPNDQVTLMDDAIEVFKKVEFVPIDGTPVTNTRDVPMSDDNEEVVNDDETPTPVVAPNEPVASGEITVNQALETLKTAGMVVVTNEDAALLTEYRVNKPALDAMTAKHNVEMAAKRDAVAKHLQLNDDQAKQLTDDIINQQYALIQPVPDYSLAAGGVPHTNEADETPDFTINDDEYGDVKGQANAGE